VPAVGTPSLVVNAMHAAVSNPRCFVLKERWSLLQPQAVYQAALLFRKMLLHPTLPLTEHHTLVTILAGFPYILLQLERYRRNWQSTSRETNMSRKPTGLPIR
jgi:hypothetical protein